MWILDSVARNGADLWDCDGGTIRRVHHQYTPPFYVHLPDPHLYREMLEELESRYQAKECRFTTIFGELEGYAVVAGRQVAEAIEQQTGFAAELYNVDLRRDQQYLAEHSMFPCGHPDESRFSPDVVHNLRQIGITVHGNPAVDRDIPEINLTHERVEHLCGSERLVLADLFSLIRACDPHVILMPDADLWMPRIVRKARKYGIPLSISTTGKFRGMDARSYWSYGRMEHKEGAVIPDGRVLIDTAQSFVYREGGLNGVLVASRLSGLCPNLVARFTPGTLISSYEIYEALKRGIAVPYRKGDAEKVRGFPEIRELDRGGMMFRPQPGIYGNVYEIDFTSLYPLIIVRANLSPETVEHPERLGFLSDVLAPLLDMRIRTKQLKKADPEYAGVDSVLKWLLVVCFGYTGYRNAKFGRIETHEGITGRSREILLLAKDFAEKLDFEVLHGIVDCLWVKGRPIDALKARVEREIGIPAEIETYSWIVFLPQNDRSGAYNRYFGRQTNGSIKVRGIAARRHDTPEYIRKMQEEMLTVMSRASTLQELHALEEPVKEIYRRTIDELVNAPVRDLAIRRRISRLRYKHRCLEGAALEAYQRLGIDVAPGMEICYVVRDAKRYFVDTEWDASVADIPYYRGLIDKAWGEIAFPFRILFRRGFRKAAPETRAGPAAGKFLSSS
jgi:DNA polymerase I